MMRCPYCKKKVGLRLVGTELLDAGEPKREKKVPLQGHEFLVKREEMERIEREIPKRTKLLEELNAKAKNAARQAKWRAKKRLAK